MEKKKFSKTGTKKPAAKSKSQTKDFLVVGLGASAGGVRALQEFFATMPPNSGMAFVVILHLSPEHESNLPQILQTQTAMKVMQVTKTIKVEPNNVYVIPPNAQLEMVDGVIRPKDAERPLGHRVAIDIFFRTLAEAYERNAICIVLSGTGSDGTLGLKRVKESNGFAIVQDPEDAEYDSMPHHAINTHLADWVLPVHQMPEKLLGFKESSERMHLTNGADAEKVAGEIHADESLREILTLLRVRTGHDFSNYKTPTLVRRVARHLQIHELVDIPTYLEYLRNNPNEIHSLLKNLLINVTNFFRDRKAFETLEAEVVPQLFAGKSSQETVRVWSAGCASGEEAFSLAILLQEFSDTLNDPPKFQIFASDVDDEAIADAREHRYPETIEADVSPDRLKRFFTREGEFYRVKKELRETVLFAPHNVLRDPPFSRLDLVTCRNLLIYLNRETQEKVLQIFHFALRQNGYLFLGSSETAENLTTLFAPVDKKYRLYSRRAALAVPTNLPLMPVAGRWEVKFPERKTQNVRDRAAALSEIHYRLLENYAPSSVLVNQDFDIVYLSGTAGKFLRFAGGEPSRNLLKAVNPDLLPDLRAALFTAQREHSPSEFPNIRVVIDGEATIINLIVRAVDVESEASDFLLVIFEERNSPSVIREADRQVEQITDKDEAMETVVRRLEEDLQRTKIHLRLTIEQHETTVEELKASNEELQAINEELRSASEELETSKEELQSVNEELITVNHELKENVEETRRANADLQNLILSTDIATIFLDRELKIKRYTPPATEIFNIIPTDLGRPLGHVTHRLEPDDFQKDAAVSLQKLRTFEREVRSVTDNRFFIARFTPYITLEDKIEGVVISFIDITEREEAEHLLREERAYADAIVETVREPLIVLDKDLRIVSASRSFYETFQVAAPQTEGKYIYDLGNRQWNIPALRDLLENILPAHSQFQDFVVEHEFQSIGRRAMMLNAREIRRRGEGRRLILLSVADISEQKQAEIVRREVEDKYRSFFETINEGFCVIEVLFDKKGKPFDYMFLDCNPAFEVQTGIENAIGRRIRDIHPKQEQFWFDIYGQVATTGSPVHFENEAAQLNRWYEVHAFRTGEAGENKVGVTFNNITERKKFEESLRKSEEQLQLILESTKDYSIITFDLEGIITRWNTGAEKIFGYTESEMLGMKGDILFTPEDRAAKVPVKEFQTALKKGRAEDERWHLRKDGSRFFASGVMQPLKDGKVEGFVKIARDQTERIKAGTILHEQEMLRQFVRTQEDERRRIARDLHDQLGQQLTALRLKIDGLKMMFAKLDIPEKQKPTAQIDELQKTSAQLDRDVDFLAWELRPASLEDLGLRLTLQNFVKEWSGYTAVKADFHTTGLGKVQLTDDIETNLYRIAQEALNNINKHAKATAVSVLLEKRRDKIVLIVEDNGIGFDINKKQKGAKGFGLTGMSERTKMIRGEFEIESEKGKGTTVFVRVPVKPINSKE